MTEEAEKGLVGFRDTAGGRGEVFRALRENGAMTQAEVSRLTGLSRATVSNVVREFAESGLVIVGHDGGSVPRSGVGRPGVRIVLNPRVGAAVGVDVGHRYMRVMVADLAHRVVAEEELELEAGHEARRVLSVAAQTIEAALERAGVSRQRVVGVGMALSGPVAHKTGEVYPSSVPESWVGSRPAEDLAEELRMQVYLENGPNLAALAELAWGGALGLRDILYVSVSDGIGAGLILDGRLYRGSAGQAGEIGHVTVVKDGPMCRCGKRGCLEALAATPALLELLRPVFGLELTVGRAIELAGEGDSACRRAIGDAGGMVGVAVAHACNLLNPQRVVVGGRLAEAGDAFLVPLRESLQREVLGKAQAQVVAGRLGQRARALGGVALALRETESFVVPSEAPPATSEAANSEGDTTHGA